MTDENKRIKELTGFRDRLREEWREIRGERLKFKEVLLKKGLSRAKIRRDRSYGKLKKKQADISKRIRHLEKEINRINCKSATESQTASGGCAFKSQGRRPEKAFKDTEKIFGTAKTQNPQRKRKEEKGRV